jgi:hypothetical protein
VGHGGPACNLSIQETEAGGSQSHASLGYIARHSLKKSERKKEKQLRSI